MIMKNDVLLNISGLKALDVLPAFHSHLLLLNLLEVDDECRRRHLLLTGNPAKTTGHNHFYL